MDVNEFFEKILTAGTTQHFIITRGDHTGSLGYFSRISNIDYYKIN